MKNIVLLGAPGTGKGTQAENISKWYGVPHISTGDIFRQAIKDQTPLGAQAKRYMDNGALVPDEITVAIARDRLAENDCANGYILDGFPRTKDQALAFDIMLAERGDSIDRVVNINVDEGTLIRRLSGRRTCVACGAGYHLSDYPPKSADECDKCGAALYQRDDDKEETIRRRLTVYNEQTYPLIVYYKEKGLIADVFVDKNNDVKELVTEAIFRALGIS